jgi:hypothetical protein
MTERAKCSAAFDALHKAAMPFDPEHVADAAVNLLAMCVVEACGRDPNAVTDMYVALIKGLRAALDANGALPSRAQGH